MHGAARDALALLARVLQVEINAATDNPLVFPSGEVTSGGNFHGEPLALALDYATLAVAELASIRAPHGAAGGCRPLGPATPSPSAPALRAA